MINNITKGNNHMTEDKKLSARAETTLTNPVEKRLELFVSNLLTSTKDI